MTKYQELRINLMVKEIRNHRTHEDKNRTGRIVCPYCQKRIINELSVECPACKANFAVSFEVNLSEKVSFENRGQCLLYHVSTRKS